MRGIFTALATPFSPSGEIDWAAYQALLQDQKEAGVTGVIPCGTTGESPTLTKDEKKRLIETAIQTMKGSSTVVFAGTGSNHTRETVEFSKWASDAGAAGVLVVTPYYNKPTQAGIVAHFTAVADAISCDLMVYNIPYYTQFDITPDVFSRLAEIPTVSYIKDSTANFMRIEQLNRIGAKVFCGCDYLNFSAMASGAAGVFTGSGNVVPELIVRLEQLINSGKIDDARKLWKRIQPISLLLWTLPFNPVAKAGSAMTGRPAGECRKPVLSLSASEMQLVKEAVDASRE